MVCPVCQSDTRVVDTRNEGAVQHRRRACLEGHRFSTTESVSTTPVFGKRQRASEKSQESSRAGSSRKSSQKAQKNSWLERILRKLDECK